MRLRNVKNKEEILAGSRYVVNNYKDYFGKWNSYFNNDNPIYIEIGIGKGNFIIENAKRYPNINFIGIEKSASILTKAIAKIPSDLSNLCIINIDAGLINNVFNHEIDLLYLNFSDPWPKKRHSDRRLTSSIFLEKYDFIFKGDQIIVQKTDNQGLFEYSLVSLSNDNYFFHDISLDYHNSNHHDIIMTEYEERFSKKGQKIYYLYAIKMSNL